MYVVCESRGLPELLLCLALLSLLNNCRSCRLRPLRSNQVMTHQVALAVLLKVPAVGSPAGSRELMLMLQSLLAERFKLVVHREFRIVSGYRLVLAKRGLKAPASAPDRVSAGRSTRSRIDCEGCTMTQLSFKLPECFSGRSWT